MLVCIIFFGVELAVASCYLYNIVAYLGFSDDGAHLVLATVVCIAGKQSSTQHAKLCLSWELL